MVLPDFVEPSPSNSFLPNAHEVGSLKEKLKILLKFSKKVLEFKIVYRAFHRFGQAKFAYGGLV